MISLDCIDFFGRKGILGSSFRHENFTILRYCGVYMLSMLRVYFQTYARKLKYTRSYLDYMCVYFWYSELSSTLLLVSSMVYKPLSWPLRSARLPHLPHGGFGTSEVRPSTHYQQYMGEGATYTNF